MAPAPTAPGRAALGHVSVNSVSVNSGVGAKQPSSVLVAKNSKTSTGINNKPPTSDDANSNAVSNVSTSTTSTTTSTTSTTSTTITSPSQPSPSVVIDRLEHIVKCATKRSPGGRGMLLSDIPTGYRQLYGGSDLPSIPKVFPGQTSLAAVLREHCGSRVAVVNGRAVSVEDAEDAEDAVVEEKVASGDMSPTTASNEEQCDSDDDDDDEDFDPVKDATVQKGDLNLRAADGFIDEAVLFAEQKSAEDEEQNDSEDDDDDDEDYDPTKNATIQKGDLNLRVTDGFIDEAVLFAEEKSTNEEEDCSDDEDWDPIKDATTQKDDMTLKAADGFIDEAALFADEEKEQSDGSTTQTHSVLTSGKQTQTTAHVVPTATAAAGTATSTTPSREILINRIESIIMLATIENDGILLRDIAPQYLREFGKGLPVKKCFGRNQTLRTALAKWCPGSVDIVDGKAVWVENDKEDSEPSKADEKPNGNEGKKDSDDDDEDYDPVVDSSIENGDMDLNAANGFFDTRPSALKNEVKTLASISPLPRDAILNRIGSIIKEASAASPTGINMATIAPVYEKAHGNKLTAKESLGMKLKEALMFFPEVDIIGTNAVWVGIDGDNSEEDANFDPITDSTIERGDTDLNVVDGVVVDEAELVLRRIESLAEEDTPNGIGIAQVRAKYEQEYGPFSSKKIFGGTLKWALILNNSQKIEVTMGKSPTALWRDAIVKKVMVKEQTSAGVQQLSEEKKTECAKSNLTASTEELAKASEELEEVTEDVYSSDKEDDEPEPVCAACAIM